MEGHQRNPVQVYIMQPRCLSVQGTLRRRQERTCLLQGFQTSGSPTTAHAYKDGVLKGYMGDGQTLFEEL